MAHRLCGTARRMTAWLLALVAAAVILTPATPAQAHDVAGVGATNFQTTLSALTPAVAGLRLDVVENGSRLQLVNTTLREVVVRGYTGEPYARVGPQGVFVNDNSPATYLNADRYGTAPIPAGVNAKAPPVWRKVSADHVYRWHDHRIHWMLKTLPVAVAQDPTVERRISNWTVTLEYAGQVLTATGSLNWVPGPSPYPWLLVAAVLAVLVGAAGLGRTRFGLLAAATALMLAADALHSVGVAIVETGSVWQRLGALLGSDATALLVWPFGILAAWRLAYRSRFAAAVAAIIAVLLGLSMALDDAPAWWRSSAPTALGLNVNRATVSIVLGTAAGLVIAVGLVWWRTRRSPTTPHTQPPVEAADDPAATESSVAEPVGVSRRGFAGYLAAGGAGMIAGAGLGVGLRAPGTTDSGVAAGAVALTDVGAGRIAFHGPQQAGIAIPDRPQAHGWIAAFDLSPGIDRERLRALLREWTAAAARLTDGQGVGHPDDHIVTGSGPCSLTVTFGFGPSLFGKAGIPSTARPDALAPLPPFPGESLDPAASDGDLGVVVAADDPLIVFHAARVLHRLAAPTARLRWQQTGFASTPGATAVAQTGRNLMGQVDGSHNPKQTDPDFQSKVFVPADAGQPAWLHGGSYLVVRRIRMLLDAWDTLKLDDQQKVIGRTKETGAPLSGGDENTPVNYGARATDGSLAVPADAHVRLAAPAFNNGAAMLRRGLSYVDGDNAGLLFVAYQADPRHGFIPVQRQLAGRDALARFIRHETSALFAIPAGFSDGGYPGQALIEGLQ